MDELLYFPQEKTQPFIFFISFFKAYKDEILIAQEEEKCLREQVQNPEKNFRAINFSTESKGHTINALIQALEEEQQHSSFETLSEKFNILHIASHGLRLEESKDSYLMIETACKCGITHIATVNASGLSTIFRHTTLQKRSCCLTSGSEKPERRNPPRKFSLVFLNSCFSNVMVKLFI